MRHPIQNFIEEIIQTPINLFLDDVRSVEWQSILECDSDPSRMFDSIDGFRSDVIKM